MLSKNSMGNSFVWFQGVVEDRNDPLRLGRMRVRCLGLHTEDREKLPTSKLPWAFPIQPITSAAMNGIGETPFGPVEGTWVMGFFRDGNLGQEPVVFGTLGGIPDTPDFQKGFTDPFGNYPRPGFVGQPDTNKLARAEFEEHPIMVSKNDIVDKEINIPIAKAHKVSSILPDKSSDVYDDLTWAEPLPRGKTKSKYPFNHVTEYEAGHVREVDSTPGAERIHEYHTAGTFYEIQSDGKKITKIVADNYEIILGDNFIKINGNSHVTIGGDCKQLVLGDLVQEVKGDYHLTVHGDKIEKITGTEAKEISTDLSVNVGGNNYEKTGKKKDQFVTDNLSMTVGKNFTDVVNGKRNVSTKNDHIIASSKDLIMTGAEGISIGTGGPFALGSNETVDIKSVGTMTVKNDFTVEGTVTADTDVVGGGKSLKTHIHSAVTTGVGTSGPPV
jgi:hypothetical protein